MNSPLVFIVLYMIDWIQLNSNEILTGITSAFVFIFIVFLLFRPWLYISKKISKDGQTYKFKVINLTLIKCTEIEIYLRQTTEIDAFPKGKDTKQKLLKVKTKSFIYVPGAIAGVLNSNRPNCLQVEADTESDVKDIVKANGTYLELIVKARHGISNLQSIKKRNFKHEQYVVDGKFHSGFTCKIKS